MLFWLFKRSKGVKLGSKAQGMQLATADKIDPKKANKWDLKWEVAELYFDVPKPGHSN